MLSLRGAADRVRTGIGAGSWAGVALACACTAVAGILFWLARSHWFFADDWTFLTRAGPEDLNLVWEPLNGHWMALTALLFAATRAVAGLTSYLPFVAPAIAAHVAVAYLLWRWQLRDDVRPWLAALVVAPFLVYGAAGENVFFAVNVGFNLSLALGLAFALLVEPPGRGTARLLVAGVVALLAVPTSTTGPVLVGVVALWLLLRRDRRGLALAAGPALVTYAGWLVVADGGAGLAGGAIGDLVEFTASLTVSAVGRLLAAASRVWGAVGLAVVAVGATAVVRRRAALGGPRPMTWMLALAGLSFALATALARVQFGVENWRSPRYAYVVAALLLPLLGVALDRLSRGPRILGPVAVALLVAATWVNATSLIAAHRAESGLEQHLRQRWIAAGQLLEDGVEPVPINVDRYWSPNLHTDHLRELIAVGDFPHPDEPVPDPWRLEALVELRSVLHGPAPFDELAAPELPGATEGCTEVAPGGSIEIGVNGPSGLEFHFERPTLARLHTTTETGRTVAVPRILHLRTPSPRAFWIGLEEAATLRTTVDHGARICALDRGDMPRYAATEPG